MSDEIAPKSALIIGASRGIGHGLALELLRRGWNVTATVRNVLRGTGFEEFHEQVTMDTVDINSLATVDAFVERVKNEVYDVVVLNAGISGPRDKTAADVSGEDVQRLFMTNTVAPMRLALRLLPTVKPGTGIIAFMSSFLGSVEGNTGGWAPLYGASKAALNSLTRQFAGGLADEDITVLSLHPGWVRTDMGGETADLDVETSVRGLADVLEAKAGSGVHEFIDYQGKILPW